MTRLSNSMESMEKNLLNVVDDDDEDEDDDRHPNKFQINNKRKQGMMINIFILP